MESCRKLAKVAFLQLFAIRKNFWRESDFFRHLLDNFLLSCVLHCQNFDSNFEISQRIEEANSQIEQQSHEHQRQIADLVSQLQVSIYF